MPSLPPSPPIPARPRTLRLPVAASGSPGREDLPDALRRPGSRGAGDPVEGLLDNVRVAQRWTLSPAGRGDAGVRRESLDADTRLLALEAVDGTAVFMRADALADQLARAHPELVAEDGTIDFASFRDGGPQGRGAGEWIWRQVTALELTPDKITELALEKAREWLGEQVTDLQAAGLTWLGAKALMWAIESRLAGPPGLYAWSGAPLDPAGRCADEHDPRLAILARPDGPPGLVFVHGAGSHTPGSFGDLTGSTAWPLLVKRFGTRIFGFEHRTFSESPIDNALALAGILPAGARISLVSHSRGGLVADLLCMATDVNAGGRDFDALVSDYRRKPRPDEADAEADDPRLAARREAVAKEEQAKLRGLGALLAVKRLRIERYVRVASPAQGTALLSDNLDLFLSGLLALVRRLGAWSAGAAVGAMASPLAGGAAKAAADSALGMLARVTLEVAARRLQPQVVPGIEAMLPEAPMGMLLVRAARRDGVCLGVVAGDIEGGGLLKRLPVMFTDWMFFDRADNDLVVDTASMYGGLARQGEARAIALRGPNINHFRYFRDETRTVDLPVPQSMQRWLCADDPFSMPEWAPLAPPEPPAAPRVSRGAGAPPDVVVLVPGLMGSHLAVRGRRVWLDAAHLARRGLEDLQAADAGAVTADGLVDLAYGRLADHLAAAHAVEPFAYDWRQPAGVPGEELAQRIERVLDAHPGRAVRILAHGMGGLVVRAAFAVRDTLWERIVATDGGLVMLGTPHHGSHRMVETLLGLSDTVRTLARVDLHHPMQELLATVAGFAGVLHLLPAPGFVEAAGPGGLDYFDPATWEALARRNDDFWFGRGLAGRPARALLEEARDFWARVADTSWVRAHPERIACVLGQAENTPCGIAPVAGGAARGTSVALLGTAEGDGAVTWASARLPGLPADRYWTMPVDHLGLASTPKHFDDIEALLMRRVPAGLAGARGGRDARGVTAPATPRTYRAGPPPPFLHDGELLARVLGRSAARVAMPQRTRPALHVTVRAMDVRYARVPVLCGHYRGDPIAGPEALIDEHLVDQALTRRSLLGLHAGELGTASIVLMPRSTEEIAQRRGRGAVVVGLGEMGRLSADDVADAVRAGVLRFLMHAADRHAEERQRCMEGGHPLHALDGGIRLASLLVGTNSAAQLSVRDSVKAVVLGVLRANAQFADAAPERPGGPAPSAAPVHVAELDLVEVYRDAAITAAYEVAELPGRLASGLKRLDATVVPCEEVAYGDGVRERLGLSPAEDYWPRLLACDAGREDDDERRPRASDAERAGRAAGERLRQALEALATRDGEAGAAGGLAAALSILTGVDQPPVARHAERLKFVYLGERARAETVVSMRQPGLVERLVDTTFQAHDNTAYDPARGFGNTLFQLLVPLEFKAAARKSANLVLVVDEATADLPWEMLEVDGEPLVRKTRMVRQLASSRFRREVSSADGLAACVIADPLTDGFHAQFGGSGGDGLRAAPAARPDAGLPGLPGAQREGEAVAGMLERAGYDVARLTRERATDVFSKLFSRAHRVLVIASHGIHAGRARDGTYRTGVVLSDGLLLSAAEIAVMERVPDLVFLSCCHLGRVGGGTGANYKLAYGLARSLIEIGVRCVVAAGWEVADDAAQTFAETFFEHMAVRGSTFADALHEARNVTFERHPACNTWGAYQAYGDPLFRLKVGVPPAFDAGPMRAPEELLRWLEHHRMRAHRAGGEAVSPEAFEQQKDAVQRRLATVPAAWSQRPDVQHALGVLYGEFGEAGFELARAALLRAIAEDCRAGFVPLAAIEKLANFEARSAERLAATGKAADADAALARIAAAQRRLELLIRLACADPGPHPGAPRGNAERQSLLGSTLKRRAAIELHRPKGGLKPALDWLRQARDAYASAESMASDDSYAVLNRLQLDALLGHPKTPDVDETIDRVREAAAQRYATDFDFWQAATRGDAELTRRLWADTLGDADAVEALLRAYEDARSINASPLRFESIAGQHRFLEAFLRKSGDVAAADTLERVAAALTGAARPAPAPGAPAPSGRGRRKRAAARRAGGAPAKDER